MARTTERVGDASVTDEGTRNEDWKDVAGRNEEFELKLEVDPADVDALLATQLLNNDGAIDRDQHSVYFDTPGHLIRKAGFSLRVRNVGGKRIQTVKAESEAAAGLFVRPEWEREIASAEPVLDDDGAPLRSLIPAEQLAQLEPVFHVDGVIAVHSLRRAP